MPVIISDKDVAAAEKSFSRKITEFKFLAMLCAAGGVAGLFMRFVRLWAHSVLESVPSCPRHSVVCCQR